MPLTARCHSLRPDKSSGWLGFFELTRRGTRSATFLVVGPAVVDKADDVQAALRAGQAAVRYLKEVPSHAPPVTLLEATARILMHESEKTGTALEFGCAVLESEELWVLTRGEVRLVPLGSDASPLGADKPLAVSASAEDRYFLGRGARGDDPARLRDFQARLEHGDGGDGGLILQIVEGESLKAVEPAPAPARTETESEPAGGFAAVMDELQRSFDFGKPESKSPTGAPPRPAPPRRPEEPRKPAPPAPKTSGPPPETGRTEPQPSRSPSPAAPPNEAVPVHPQLSLSEASAPAGYAPEETRGLTFWLSVVAAGAALGGLVGYLVLIRPSLHEGSGAGAADGGGVRAAVIPDSLAAVEETVWEDHFTQPITSTPVVAGDKVVFGCRDGRVYALSREDGHRIWAYAASDGFGSSPALAGKTILIGGYDGRLYALDADTGEERWVFGTKGRIVSSPTVDANTVYVGSYDHQLYAVNLEDGALRWARDLEAVIWSSPAEYEGVVIAAGLDGRLTAMNTQKGKVLWRAATGGAVYSSPVIGDGRVFTGSADGSVYAFDLADGKPVWKTPVEGGEVNGSPAIHENRLVVGTDSGRIAGLDTGTGEMVWTRDTEAQIKSRPAFQESMVWVTGYDGYLHGIDWRNGNEAVRLRTDSSAFSSPVIRDHVAFFGAMDGRFLAIRVGPTSS